ncbi:MAG: hypothetical protein ABII00_12395 [Elusimicrobiota bacterium]
MNKAAWAVIGVNLMLFIGVTSTPAFQMLHHHWIFPVLATLLAVEWAATVAVGRLMTLPAFLDVRASRSAALSIFAFLILMGIVRHYSILTCFGVCSLKLGSAVAVAAAVFATQSLLKGEGFWNAARSRAVALACVLWSVYLLFFGRGVAPERLEPVYLGLSAVLIIAGRRTPQIWIVAFGTLFALAMRRIGGEHAIIAANLLTVVAGLWLVGRLSRPHEA